MDLENQEPQEEQEKQNDNEKLLSALRKERENARVFENELKQYKALGVDLPELKAFIDSKKEAEKQDKEKSGKFEELKADFQSELEKIRQEKEALANELKQNKISSTVDNVLMQNDDIMPNLKKFVKAEIMENLGFDDMGNPVILDRNGFPALNPETGENKTVSDFIKDLRLNKDWADVFKADIPKGFQTQGKQSTGKAPLLPKNPSYQDIVNYREKYGEEALRKAQMTERI